MEGGITKTRRGRVRRASDYKNKKRKKAKPVIERDSGAPVVAGCCAVCPRCPSPVQIPKNEGVQACADGQMDGSRIASCILAAALAITAYSGIIVATNLLIEEWKEWRSVTTGESL